jgi:hypothetical protein
MVGVALRGDEQRYNTLNIVTKAVPLSHSLRQSLKSCSSNNRRNCNRFKHQTVGTKMPKDSIDARELTTCLTI